MEENSSKRKQSLPPNYISISDLKRRWNEDKERKQKEAEEEERRRKQEIEEQLRKREEEDLKKREQKKESVVSETGDGGLPKKKKKNKGKSRKRYDSRKTKNHDVVAVEECGEEAKGNGRRDDVAVIETEFEDVVPKKKKNIRRHRKKQVQNVVVERRTESKTVAKGEKLEGNGPREEAVMALETECENLSMGREEIEELKEQTRSRNFGKRKKKKENQDVVAVGENVVECKSIVTEKKSPVKGVIRVYREKAKGNGSCEEAVTAIETQFEKLSMERGETKELKEQTRSVNFGKRKKKESQDVVAVGESVVECESKTPVKGVTGVYREKGGEKAKSNGPREEAVMAIETEVEKLSMERGETKELKEQTRSRKFEKRKKKKNQDVVDVGENVVECESKTPVKGVIGIYKEKGGEKAKGNGPREEAFAAIGAQFEKLSVKTNDSKTETRPKQRRDLGSQRVRMDVATMVWVKKGKNERDGDGIASGVKPLNA